jgi:cyclic pyranopterin monophosphate synthase
LSELTHLDDQGRPRMVDVGDKEATPRRAVAEALVVMSRETRQRLFDGDLPKGDALAVVRIAAIQGAKRTADLVPLCHPIPIDAIDIDIEPTEEGARLLVEVAVLGKTGVEMEAMTGAAVGSVTLYDMIKGVDRSASIGPIRLLSKSGGRSGDWVRE